MRSKMRLVALVTTVAATMSVCPAANAATVYWRDQDGTTTWATSGGTNENWNQNSSSGARQLWANGDDAVFAGSGPSAAGTVTVVDPVTVRSIDFSTLGAWTI